MPHVSLHHGAPRQNTFPLAAILLATFLLAGCDGGDNGPNEPPAAAPQAVTPKQGHADGTPRPTTTTQANAATPAEGGGFDLYDPMDNPEYGLPANLSAEQVQALVRKVRELEGKSKAWSTRTSAYAHNLQIVADSSVREALFERLDRGGFRDKSLPALWSELAGDDAEGGLTNNMDQFVEMLAAAFEQAAIQDRLRVAKVNLIGGRALVGDTMFIESFDKLVRSQLATLDRNEPKLYDLIRRLHAEFPEFEANYHAPDGTSLQVRRGSTPQQIAEREARERKMAEQQRVAALEQRLPLSRKTVLKEAAQRLSRELGEWDGESLAEPINWKNFTDVWNDTLRRTNAAQASPEEKQVIRHYIAEGEKHSTTPVSYIEVAPDLTVTRLTTPKPPRGFFTETDAARQHESQRQRDLEDVRARYALERLSGRVEVVDEAPRPPTTRPQRTGGIVESPRLGRYQGGTTDRGK
jgi:hypothetical protein